MYEWPKELINGWKVLQKAGAAQCVCLLADWYVRASNERHQDADKIQRWAREIAQRTGYLPGAES